MAGRTSGRVDEGNGDGPAVEFDGVHMKLLLFSDLHLDTPFRWAGPALARARRHASPPVITTGLPQRSSSGNDKHLGSAMP